MALSTARIHRVRGRPPLLAAGITSLIHSHSSSVRSLGYIFSFIYPFYTTREDFSDRLLETGIPVEIERRGKILKIVPTEMPKKLDNLIDRRDFVRGDPEDIVHLDWSSAWQP